MILLLLSTNTLIKFVAILCIVLHLWHVCYLEYFDTVGCRQEKHTAYKNWAMRLSVVVVVVAAAVVVVDFGWGSTTDPAGGAYSAPQTPSWI